MHWDTKLVQIEVFLSDIWFKGDFILECCVLLETTNFTQIDINYYHISHFEK